MNTGILVHDVRLSYRQTGHGPDLLLVHGLGANMAFWPISLLARLGARCRVTTYDLRGHGYSDMPPSGYTTAAMAADLEGLLDQLGIEQADVVGHSYGGAVALHHALRRPDRVRSLVLADARVAALQPTQRVKDWEHGERWCQRWREAGVEVSEDQALDHSLLDLAARPELQAARQRLRDTGDGAFVPFTGWNGGRRTAERWRRLINGTTARLDVTAPGDLTADRLRGMHCPALLVYGELSHCLPTLAELSRCLSNTQAIIMAGVGHFHPALRPELFSAHVLRFLEERRAS